MPGKDELRAKLLATLMAPAQNLAATLAAGATNFMYLLDGSTIRPANNVNFSYFNHQPYIDLLRAADALSVQPRLEAFGRLDLDTMRDWGIGELAVFECRERRMEPLG